MAIIGPLVRGAKGSAFFSHNGEPGATGAGAALGGTGGGSIAARMVGGVGLDSGGTMTGGDGDGEVAGSSSERA
jgi:hypothetical protein